MGKLYDLLYAIIDRVNKSVKTTAQALSEGEKTQARTNIGAMPSTYVPPNQTAQQVGADPKGTASAAVSEHNTSPTSHEDIRSIITGLTERLNALANSDDTTLDQMKEVVEYIKDNRELIESVTTSKVNVTDIVNNLTTNVSNKPLSAAQGVILKGLIDTLSAEALRTSDVVNTLTSSSTTKPLSAYQGNMLRKMIESAGGGGGIALEGAKANQYPVIKAVDVSGKPTEWEAADRTHWKEVIGADMTVLAETSVRFTNSTATVSGFVAGAIKEGQTYLVNWNGTEYPCKAYLDDGIVHLGNSALAGGSVTTSDPFCIVGAGTTCMVFKNTENTETITLKVDGVAEVVYHQIDPKYIKDMYYTEGGRVEVLNHTITDPPVLTLADPIGLVAGEEYTVVVNGVENACVAQEAEDEGYTFVILVTPEWQIMDYSPEAVAATGIGAYLNPYAYTGDPPVTFSIYHDAETVHKLDHKYLPDGVPYCVRGGKVEILPETTVTLEEEGMGSCGVIPLSAGATCIVNWNGTEHECVAIDYSEQGGEGSILIGNGAMMGMADTGEPFLIGSIPAQGMSMVFAFDGTVSTDITLSIVGETEVLNKLTPKLLPDTVAEVYNVYFELSESDSTATTEQTFQQIYAKAAAENTIVRGIGNMGSETLVFNLTYISDGGVEFTCLTCGGGAVTVYYLGLKVDGSCTFTQHILTEA